MLFDRFLLLSFLRLFGTVSFVGVFLVSLYALLDFILGFKVRDPQVGLEYFLLLLPLGFYYISPALLSVSLFLFMKRTLEKKIDLISQSFGVSPLRFSAPLLGFSLGLSFVFLAGNQFLFPSLSGKLWYIEKTYKKKQEAGGIVRNFWFLKKEEGKRTYYYIGTLDLSRNLVFNLSTLEVLEENLQPLRILKVETGIWKEKEVKALGGYEYVFEEGKKKPLKGLTVPVGLSLGEVELFSERIDFLPLSYLFALARKGEAFGFNADVYLGEALFRITFSFFPFVLALLLLYLFLRTRDPRKVIASFLLLLPLLWTASVFPKILTQKTNQPFFLSLVPLAVVGLFLLKGIHNLGKGFRV
ncbi:MAG: LptF/LptG family permease [Aquificae bacterium]|nr:LptF/LptG family permease [Aquificota bacterium]